MPTPAEDPGTEPRPALARYFFSIRYRDRVLPDREGVELASGADIRQCALYLADRLRNDGALAEVHLDGCAVEVSDGRGDHVLTVFLPTAA